MSRPTTQACTALLTAVFLSSPGEAAQCPLNNMAEQLLAPELRSDTPQYATTDYRKQLLRFVNGYYSQLAGDLLRGEGEYLTALHRLMGSGDSERCTATYRAMLLEETSSQNLGLALWRYRQADSTGSQAAGETE